MLPSSENRIAYAVMYFSSVFVFYRNINKWTCDKSSEAAKNAIYLYVCMVENKWARVELYYQYSAYIT